MKLKKLAALWMAGVFVFSIVPMTTASVAFAAKGGANLGTKVCTGCFEAIFEFFECCKSSFAEYEGLCTFQECKGFE